MASNYTENYGLCQWEATDQVLREEFNQDNAKIDKVLQELTNSDKILEENLAQQTATISRCGNCQIFTTSYTGNGKYGTDNPTKLVLPAKPTLLIIYYQDTFAISVPSTGRLSCMTSNGSIWSCTASWSDSTKTLSYWGTHPDYQMNRQDRTYAVVALIAADA